MQKKESDCKRKSARERERESVREKEREREKGGWETKEGKSVM